MIPLITHQGKPLEIGRRGKGPTSAPAPKNDAIKRGYRFESLLVLLGLRDSATETQRGVIFVERFALVLAAIAIVAFPVCTMPSAQAYVYHHRLSHHHGHHQPYARSGSPNGDIWSSDRLNGHGINDLGVTTNSGRKYNGG
jgi:hypothetical protein